MSPRDLTPIPISLYLETLNRALRDAPGRIIGEVSQPQLYPGRSYLFFSLKDAKSEAMIKCIMWKTDYKISGIELEEGMEVIVSGFAEIYRPNGSLTFKAQTVELVGEGALKKAYDELKKKLELEGVFADAKKRGIPQFPVKIGVITSKDGAVINDFLTNIGRHGYEISLIDSRVEGQLATDELIRSVRSFRNKDIDVLVIIRGGGSMESLLPFNNEMLVREIARFPKPVIAGIGHDKDITLVALAADLMVSTPTAVTAVLNDSWDQAFSCVELWESRIMSGFRDALYAQQSRVTDHMSDIKDNFQNILERFTKIEYRLREELNKIQYRLTDIRKEAERKMGTILQAFAAILKESSLAVATDEQQLATNNPERLLKLGYSITRIDGKVLKSTKEAKAGDIMSVRLKDGEVEGEVKRVI
jgi:exodeoxyribonuclease VII large subunit